MTQFAAMRRVCRRLLGATGFASALLAGGMALSGPSSASAAWVVRRPVVVAPARPVWAVPLAPQPVYVARPVGPVVVPAGRRVIVHPKVYVRGQPVRNAVRAVTP